MSRGTITQMSLIVTLITLTTTWEELAVNEDRQRGFITLFTSQVELLTLATAQEDRQRGIITLTITQMSLMVTLITLTTTWEELAVKEAVTEEEEEKVTMPRG